MLVTTVSTVNLSEPERLGVVAEAYGDVLSHHRDEIQRVVDQRIAQGFTVAEALRCVERDLRAARRARAMRDTVRLHLHELL
jgi:hypothetical protein